MYRPVLIVLFVILLFWGFRGRAQQSKPVFKKITYVYYRFNKIGRKNSVLIEHWLEVNATGMLHIASNSNDGEHYTGLGTDTSFLLPDTTINELNKIFNGRRKLSSYRNTGRQPDPGFFAGPLIFLSYTTKNNVTDELILVDGLFDKNLEKVLNDFWVLPHAKLIHHVVITNKALESRIAKYQNAADYLPEIKSPPTKKNLR